MAQPKKTAYCGNCKWYDLRADDDGYTYDICRTGLHEGYMDYYCVCHYFAKSRTPRKVKKRRKRFMERQRQKYIEYCENEHLPF